MVDGLGTRFLLRRLLRLQRRRPAAPIVDPAHPGTTYHAQWYSNAPLGSATPIPLATARRRSRSRPTKTTVVDECFDELQRHDLDHRGRRRQPHGHARLPLDGPGRAGRSGTRGHAPVPRRSRPRRRRCPSTSATCTSSDGGVTGVSSSAASPIVVTGLTNGRTYTCVVATTVADVTYVSAATAALVPQGTDPPAPPLRTSTNAAPTNTAVAFTGAAADDAPRASSGSRWCSSAPSPCSLHGDDARAVRSF